MNINRHRISLKLIYLLLFLQTCRALYSNVKNVVDLTPKNFDNLVIKSDEIWIVEFYAPWCTFCKNLVPEYTKLANVVNGVVKVGAVNADEHRELAAIYNIRGLPTIKMFVIDKQKPEDYNDGKNAKELVETILNLIKVKVVTKLDAKEQEAFLIKRKREHVAELTDKNFDDLVLRSDNMWMVEFYAPWCGHCRNLEPHWTSAAKQLKDKVKFGALDSTVNRIKSAQYEITGFPTIKLFTPGSSPIHYDGGRKARDIVAWTKERFAEPLPEPEIFEIVNENLLIKQCQAKKLCIVAFLPSISDCQATCRNFYIAILQNLAKRFKSNRWCWLWSEAHAQPEVENLLNIRGSEYPALVTVSYQNKRYTLFIGAFTEDNIYDFLINLYAGNGKAIPINADVFPKIFTIDPWDGQDAAIPLIEEKDEL